MNRRSFLKSIVIVGTVAATVPLTAAMPPLQSKHKRIADNNDPNIKTILEMVDRGTVSLEEAREHYLKLSNPAMIIGDWAIVPEADTLGFKYLKADPKFTALTIKSHTKPIYET